MFHFLATATRPDTPDADALAKMESIHRELGAFMRESEAPATPH